MHCGSCVSKVQQALSAIEGVEDVEVNLLDGLVKVSGAVKTEYLLQAILKSGYKASPIYNVESKKIAINKKSQKSELRKLFPLLLIFIYLFWILHINKQSFIFELQYNIIWSQSVL